MSIQPVILSGGSGTRLWPMSRERYPKQLLAVSGDWSLLQQTALRLHGMSFAGEPVGRPVVVCNEEYRFITAEQLRQAGTPAECVVLEPVGRNTAPALALAALLALVEGGDPILLVMPADHLIGDTAAFREAIVRGAEAAADGAVVTFGITPDRPETGYGYIRVAPPASDGAVPGLDRFVEKPDAATAQQYLDCGEYLWNSGLFMGRASVWCDLLRRYRPDILAACETALQEGEDDHDFFRVGKAAFTACPSDSIDYAVMERLAAEQARPVPAVVVPLSAGWSDVGAWDALWQVSGKDEAGNVLRGDVMLQDSRDSLVFSESRLVSCVGIDNLVVVETADAVMVAAKDRTQDVKKIVARLKTECRDQAQAHRKVYRPWGSYDAIDSGDRFQVKRIVVKPGASLSLQMHHHRAEHWIVVRGTARVTRGEEVFLLAENESTYIPLGTTHRLENPGKVPLEIIEVQSGAYLGEDDIVRFEDTYGRS
jgi:mannose-1-phosphate guanylyltransferase/mannose-6-phosphate isomerase